MNKTQNLILSVSLTISTSFLFSEEKKQIEQNFVFDAPNLNEENGVLYANSGFILTITDSKENTVSKNIGEIVVTGDAMRYDRIKGLFFAVGHITVNTDAGVQMQAEKIGFNQSSLTGNAWGVSLYMAKGEGKISRIFAEKLTLKEDEFTFFETSFDSGHGSIIKLISPTIKVRLSKEDHKHRKGFLKKINDITIKHSRFMVGNVQCFYWPYSYTDYSLDYPWTKYEIGKESHLGYYLNAQIGTGIPAFYGFHSRIKAKLNYYSLSGYGYGGEFMYNNKFLGKGNLLYYRMDEEDIYSTYGKSLTETRTDVSVMDFQHYAKFPGGAIAIRTATLPNADSIDDNGDRFRGDFLKEYMETTPLVRDGIAAVYANEFGGISLFSEKSVLPNPNNNDEINRLISADLRITPISLIGPIYANAKAKYDIVEKKDYTLDTREEFTRSSKTIEIGAMKWFRGFGFEAKIGKQFLSYKAENELGKDSGGNSFKTSDTDVSYYECSLKTRIIGRYENGITNNITPKLGLSFYDKLNGDDLPSFNIGDGYDTLEDDKLYLFFELSTDIIGANKSFGLDLIARFGLRDKELMHDVEGVEVLEKDNKLVDIVGTAKGSPAKWMEITGNFKYDGLKDTFSSYDLLTSLTFEHVEISNNSIMHINISDEDRNYWEHKPEIKIKGNRYNLLLSAGFSDEKEYVDASDTNGSYKYDFERTLSITIERKVNEGLFTLTYERTRGENNKITDEHTRINFIYENF